MRYSSAFALAVALVTAGCETMSFPGKYDPVGYKPKNVSNVTVKVSLNNSMVYVMEGNKPLLVTATSVGTPQKPTPSGRFRVTNKIVNKRSNTYGFWARGNTILPGTSSKPPGSGFRYVGFPMQYWVEFAPAYGFHVGSVWPVPRTHGCLRLHKNAAREFFELVRVGTPVSIAYAQPEDSTLGRNPPRPTDYRDPDPPNSVLISPRIFQTDESQHLRERS